MKIEMSQVMIAENLEIIKKGLPESVQLIAVSKTKPSEFIQEAYDAGQRDFGENRIQEMAEKFEGLPKDIRWHMIGHVQGNKMKYMAPFVHMVHGMDKEKRFKELNKEAEKNNRKIGCLVQVHIAKEESKFGFSFEEAKGFLSQDLETKYPFLKICGLMGMATNTEDTEVVGAEFSELSQFFKECQKKSPSPHFNVLSMGMSGDYLLAVEQGSNMVRIGSSIFGSRN